MWEGASTYCTHSNCLMKKKNTEGRVVAPCVSLRSGAKGMDSSSKSAPIDNEAPAAAATAGNAPVMLVPPPRPAPVPLISSHRAPSPAPVTTREDSVPFRESASIVLGKQRITQHHPENKLSRDGSTVPAHAQGAIKLTDVCPQCLVEFASRGDLIAHLDSAICGGGIAAASSSASTTVTEGSSMPSMRREESYFVEEKEDDEYFVKDGNHFEPTLDFSVARSRSRCLTVMYEMVTERKYSGYAAGILFVFAFFFVLASLFQVSIVSIFFWLIVLCLGIARHLSLNLNVDRIIGARDDDYDWLKDALEMVVFVGNVSVSLFGEAVSLTNPRASIFLATALWLISVLPWSWICIGTITSWVIPLFLRPRG